MEASTAIAKIHVSRRFAAIAIVTSLLLGIAAFWGTNKQVLGLFHDDGIYTVVAKSLYQGDGYRIISLPSTPTPNQVSVSLFFVSWLWAFDPTYPNNIAVLKTLNVAIFIAICFISVVYYRRHFAYSNVGAIAFGLLVCTNPIVFTFTDYVVSDLS